jgi:hypothetical protein
MIEKVELRAILRERIDQTITELNRALRGENLQRSPESILFLWGWLMR